MFKQICEKVISLHDCVQQLQETAIAEIGREAANRLFLVIRNNCYQAIQRKSQTLSKKLRNLRQENRNIQNIIEHNNGSRKLIAHKYVKDKDLGESSCEC